MKKIGFIDLDTSHPRSFVKRINAIDEFKVTGVFDRGRVKGSNETESFCQDMGAEAYSSVSELAKACDGIMILSADWETHYEDLEVCLQAGIPCYVDKPMVGRLDEVEKLTTLCSQTGTPLFGGSGWRWNQKIQSAQQEWKGARLENLLIPVPAQRFYYGIHGIELMLGLLGPGISWVELERVGDGFTVFSLGHKRGNSSRLILELPSYKVSRFNSFMVEGHLHSVSFDGDDVHNGLCQTFAHMVKTGQAPATPAELLESVYVAFALEEAVISRCRVRLEDPPKVREISSAAFMTEYCSQARTKQN